ncbi:MAG: tetratricopeptide repeat protein [Kiritimatiellae bacterium]|nr:tetratricopeptide repeat protein [Kiritimatiellia bacterium]
MLVPLPWGREVGHAVSRIVDVSTRDGRRVCLIRSQIDLESLGCSGYRPTAMSPRMRVQGTAEGLLDLDRGLWQEMRWDLASAFEGSGFEGETRLTSAIELEAVRTLPPREDARRRRHVRALDAALSLVYAGHVDKALGRLEKDERRAEAGAWKSGLSVALALLEPLRETGADGAVASREAEPGGPEAALMREADTAACGGNWEKAVAAYERFVKRFPRHDWVPECLAAAAMICEQKLNRPDKAGALNNKAVAFLEEAAGGKRQPMALYELAGAYARAGQLAKAADAYRSFLMTRDGEMEPGSKMLGYYRLGGLLEEMGETGAAVEAYQALERLTPENDYSKRLKQKAEARLRELAGEKGGSANEAGDGK